MVYMQYSHELEIKFPTWMGIEPWHSGLSHFNDFFGKLARLWTHNPVCQGSSPI